MAHGPSIESEVSRLLTARHLTVAVAESCTGGLLGHRLTSVSGSSAYFLGGIVSYANAVKVRELDIPKDMLQREGAVSRSVASRMAAAVKQRFGADVGIGVTGIAGPGGATRGKPVGLVYVAIAWKDLCEVRRFDLKGDRLAVKNAASEAALRLLCELVE